MCFVYFFVPVACKIEVFFFTLSNLNLHYFLLSIMLFKPLKNAFLSRFMFSGSLIIMLVLIVLTCTNRMEWCTIYICLIFCYITLILACSFNSKGLTESNYIPSQQLEE